MPVANVSTRVGSREERRLRNRLFVFQNPAFGRDDDQNVTRISNAVDQLAGARKALALLDRRGLDGELIQTIEADLRAAEETLKEVLFEEGVSTR